MYILDQDGISRVLGDRRQPAAVVKGLAEALHQLALRALGQDGVGLRAFARLDVLGDVHGDAAVLVFKVAERRRHVGIVAVEEAVVDLLRQQVGDGSDAQLHSVF